jgi:hypothetical protein
MISLEKLTTQAPDLISRYNMAKRQFVDLGKAAVYLVVDTSGSMRQLIRDGAVQDLGERMLGLSAAVDDDGIVPTVLFNTGVRELRHLVIGQHQGFARNIKASGGTRFAPAMRAVIDYHQSNEIKAPALVLFQTDGDQEDEEATSKLLVESSDLAIFWQFFGMGKTMFPRLSRFDTLIGLSRSDILRGRTVNNTDLIIDPCRTHNGKLISILTDEQLYSQLSTNYARWLCDAECAGIL